MLRNIMITYIIAAVAIFIGTLLPWASLMGISANGSDTDDGKLMFVFAAIVAVAALLAVVNRPFWSRVLGLLGCLLALAEAIYEIVHVTNHSYMGMHPSAGSGLWIILIGSLFGLIGTFVASRSRVSF